MVLYLISFSLKFQRGLYPGIHVGCVETCTLNNIKPSAEYTVLALTCNKGPTTLSF